MGGNNLSLTIKKQLVCKPGSVPHKSEVPVIYLSLLSPTGFIGPPSGIGRGCHQQALSVHPLALDEQPL